MSTMMDCFDMDSLALPLAEQLLAGMDKGFEGAVVDGSGFVSCHFSPTHSPNPSLAPPGERGVLHLAASMKVGTLRSTARWPQSEGNPATGRCSQISRRSSWPALDFPVCRPETAQTDQALSQRQLAATRLQPIENPPAQFDGSAPLRTFFPPLTTRPHVAVSSLSAPAGVERVGVRGGIQRIKNKNAADNQFGNSNHDNPRVPKELQKQEQTMYIARGLEAGNVQGMMATAQLAAASRELPR